MPRHKPTRLFGPHPVDVHIGQRIRERRLSCRISQSELGKCAGITFQQVQKYERGANRVSGSMLYEFANTLGVPVSYFYDGLAHGEIAKASPDDQDRRAYASSKEGLLLLDIFRRIPVNLRKPAIELLSALAGDDVSEA